MIEAIEVKGAPVHDSEMPEGWHKVKNVLLTEMRSAAIFRQITEAADALSHARLVGERIARDVRQACGEKGEDKPSEEFIHFRDNRTRPG